MSARNRFWMASALALCFCLGAASANAEPAYSAQPAKYTVSKPPRLQLGTGIYVGTVTRFSDRKGRIVRAELTTDKGKILMVKLKGPGLDLARKSGSQRVEVNGKATMFASSNAHGIELVVDRWKAL